MPTWDREAVRRVLRDRLSLADLQAASNAMLFDVRFQSMDAMVGKFLQMLPESDLDRLMVWIGQQQPGIDLQALQAQAPATIARVQPVWDNYDFHMAITSAGRGRYRVEVYASPAGNATTEMALRLNQPEIERGLGELQRLAFNSQSVRVMGTYLKNQLLSGDVGSAYYKTLGIAEKGNFGVRLRLRLDPPELKRLPWEFMYDSWRQKFLVFDRVAVLRYPSLGQGLGPLDPLATVRVLMLLSAPRGMPELHLGDEQRRVEEALSQLRAAGRVRLVVEANPTRERINQHLNEDQYHIIHYSGHAGFNTDGIPTNPLLPRDLGYVVLPDDQGDAEYIDEESFARFFDRAPSVRLVLLNACQSGEVSLRDRLSGLGEKLVQQAGIRAVVAMQFRITDRQATNFATEFYQPLAVGVPIDVAVSQARGALSQIYGQSDRAWGTPVLFMRADDGRLFTAP